MKMQGNIAALIAQFEQEAAKFAALVRQAKLDGDKEMYLENIRLFDQRKGWIYSLQKHLA
jgi:hypothetical protein